jgi:hypothetical protein
MGLQYVLTFYSIMVDEFDAPRKLRENEPSCFPVVYPWACGAAGSALPWHGRGRRFDPDQVHHLYQLLADTSLSMYPAAGPRAFGQKSHGCARQKCKWINSRRVGLMYHVLLIVNGGIEVAVDLSKSLLIETVNLQQILF